MKPSAEPKTPSGSSSTPLPSRLSHRKLVVISGVTLAVVVIAITGYYAWKLHQAEVEQRLMDQYRAESMQAAQDAAQAFFKANPPVSSTSSIAAASAKAAQAFFKANPPTVQTNSQQQADYQQFQALQDQDFAAWKAAQAK